MHPVGVGIDNALHRPRIVERIRRHARHFGDRLAEFFHSAGNLLDMILLVYRIVRHAGHPGIHVRNTMLHLPNRRGNLVHHGAQIALHGLDLAQQRPHFIPDGKIQLGIEIALHDVPELIAHNTYRATHILVDAIADKKEQEDL